MKLHNYQHRAAEFIEQHQRAILSVGMGLGKTAATLTAVERLQPETLLIVAPKRVAETVWMQEAEKWGLTATASKMVIVKGNAKQRAAAWDDDTKPYKVVGRDNIGDLFKDKGHPKEPSRRFEMMVLDELTSFKAITSKRTERIFELAKRATRCVGLTGTFLANGAIDIFGQVASVGLARELRGFYSWRAKYFRDVMVGSGQAWSKWRLTVPMAEVLRPLQPYVFTLDSKDWLDIPEVELVHHPVELDEDERNRYDSLAAFLSVDIDGVGVSVKEEARFAKLQTMCDGFIYQGTDIDGQWVSDDILRAERSSKLEAVADFCRQCVAEGENVLLFYAFRAEREWLREMLSGEGYDVMEVRDKGALDKWLRGDYNGVLLAHPASAGHGLNMQSGGRILVWSTLTYNYEYYAQANARLARQGQRRGVQIHTFTATDTVEDGKLKALEQKDKEQAAFVGLTNSAGSV